MKGRLYHVSGKTEAIVADETSMGDFPDVEISNGIVSVSVEWHGDAPRVPYITVYGYDKDKCIASWNKTYAKVRALNLFVTT